MKYTKAKNYGTDAFDNFVNNSLKDLKSGMEVYAYSKNHVEEIKNRLKKRSNVEIDVRKEDYYFVLTPIDKKRKKEEVL